MFTTSFHQFATGLATAIQTKRYTIIDTIAACLIDSRYLTCAFVIFALLQAPAPAVAQAADEYAVKAAFLFNLSKFIEWPGTAVATSFSICILGDDPFGFTIDKTIRGKTVSGRMLEVRRVKSTNEAAQCQIVFVRRESAKVLKAGRSLPVATVGETEEFMRAGGMFYLSIIDGHITVVINHAAADQAGLKISAKLLGLARNPTAVSANKTNHQESRCGTPLGLRDRIRVSTDARLQSRKQERPSVSFVLQCPSMLEKS